MRIRYENLKNLGLFLIALCLSADGFAFGSRPTVFMKSYDFSRNDSGELLSCECDGIFYYEEFRPVVGYEGLYDISSFGRIKSHQPHLIKNKKDGRFLHPALFRNGYYRVKLSKNGDRRLIGVHRLVAMAFIPNPENKPEVNHIGGVRNWNIFFKLEWNTRRENALHAIEIGMNNPPSGKNHWSSKRIIHLQTGLIYESIKEASMAHGVVSTTIVNKIKSGRDFDWAEPVSKPISRKKLRICSRLPYSYVNLTDKVQMEGDVQFVGEGVLKNIQREL